MINQMDYCLNCNGAIMPPNVPMGYGGQICYCPKDPKYQYQRPSKNERSAYESIERKLGIAKEALENISKDKFKCKEFGLNFEGYILYATKELEKIEGEK